MAIKDFDAYLNERRQISENGFTLFDETVMLPPTMPFDAVLLFKQIAKRAEEGDSKTEVTEDDLLPLLESLLGKDVLDRLRQHRDFDIDLMTKVLTWALEAYNQVDPKVTKDTVQRAKRSR